MDPEFNLEARLGQYLEGADLVSPQDLKRARLAADAAGHRLDIALIELGLVTENALTALLRSALGVEDHNPEMLPRAAILTELLPTPYLATVMAIPMAADAAKLTLGMAHPYDDFCAKAIALKTGRRVTRVRMSRLAFEQIWSELYGDLPGVPSRVADEVLADNPNAADVVTLKDSASDAPVVRFVQNAIRAAVSRGASDIHLKPLDHGAEMLFRIDGMLEAQPSPEPHMFPAVISRLKILANLDISERRLPQDGKIRANVAGRAVDIRLSTMAHVHGEGAVLRLLSRELARTSLQDLGFSDGIARGLEHLFSATEGLILVTGPTGSGKSTTLHAMLQRLVKPELNVVTIEDPVEYRIDGISQIQVDEKIGLTFPRILRSVLRQDPDIIMVGEIRDGETAAIAVQAALTGHLVLATLHTNSALAAVPRLVDMGIEPYLLAAVLRGVLAQRLLRRLCPDCGAGANGLGPETASSGAPCTSCGGTHYSGRVAIGELALLDGETIEALALSNTLPDLLQRRLSAGGYVPLKDDALARLKAGEIPTSDLAAVA